MGNVDFGAQFPNHSQTFLEEWSRSRMVALCLRHIAESTKRQCNPVFVPQFLPNPQALLVERMRRRVVVPSKGHSTQIVEQAGDPVLVPQFPSDHQTFFQK